MYGFQGYQSIMNKIYNCPEKNCDYSTPKKYVIKIQKKYVHKLLLRLCFSMQLHINLYQSQMILKRSLKI